MEKYKDASLEIGERVEDLLGRMTLKQKVAQLLCMFGMGNDPAITLSHFPDGIGEVAIFTSSTSAAEIADFNKRISEYVTRNEFGIPPIIHVEALTGVNSAEATIFPSAIGLGATFNPETVRKMGDIIRKQMLAVGYRQALSPVMDVARDPRWGRIGETYGEDPAHVAEMSVAFVQGIQGNDLREGAVATGKHFLGYSVSDGGLNMASNPIPMRELREVFAKPFQAAITEAGMASIMNSYGSIDGEMIIASPSIMTSLLHDEMHFDGFMVSDYMSIDRMVNHHISPDKATAGIEALKAGLDVECPVPFGYGGNLLEAVASGEMEEAYIDRAVRRVLTAKFKLGLFEDALPKADWFAGAYLDASHREHSLKAAHEATVLLKNEGLLPLAKDTKKIAVIGPHGDDLRLLFGCYTFPANLEMQMSRSMDGMPGMASAARKPTEGFEQTKPYPGCEVLRQHPDVTNAIQSIYGGITPTIRTSIQQKCPNAEIVYQQGCDIAGNDRSRFEEAIAAAKDADIVILTLGGKYGWGLHCTIGEGIDCDDIGLPGIQEEFAKEIYATGTPVVMVHMDARPLSSEFIAEHFPAIIEYWYPGVTGGEALADVLFGDYSPAGRMPVTTARNAGQIPIYSGQRIGNSYYSEMSISKYCEGTMEPLFYFGQGQGYASFEYTNLQVTPVVSPDGVLKVTCDITNTGVMDSDEVAQLYIRDELASMIRPAMEFAGSIRVHVKKGETKRIAFEVRADQFAFLNREMQWVVEEGDMQVMVGAASNDIRLKGSFHIDKSAVVEGHRRGFYAKSTEV